MKVWLMEAIHLKSNNKIYRTLNLNVLEYYYSLHKINLIRRFKAFIKENVISYI